jgi:hypothetical protein
LLITQPGLFKQFWLIHLKVFVFCGQNAKTLLNFSNRVSVTENGVGSTKVELFQLFSAIHFSWLPASLCARTTYRGNSSILFQSGLRIRG